MNNINKGYLPFHNSKYLELNIGDNIQFLYHYSSVDRAMKLLSTNAICFENLNYLNNTTERKPKIQFSKN